MAQLKNVKIEKFSGYIPSGLSKSIIRIKKRDFFVINDFSVGGDAPKDFIQLYQYGKVRRYNTKKWTKYIAKTGHKWYPNESITEHLLNCIGKELGLFMSNSSLALISGQLRYLSEYFLDNQQQELIHGVDIFADYLSDRDIVEEIENQKLARDFFTFQFAIKAIKFVFPENYEELTLEFVKLLVFDAIVGNNDRHFYNWGIIKSINDSEKPYFSPIFDTARGLFWNATEQKIVEKLKEKHQLQKFLEDYIRKSYPKTGWEGEKNLNHIVLIGKIIQQDVHFRSILEGLITPEREAKVLEMIKSNFSPLLSVNRLFLISECLKIRFQLLRSL